MTIPSATKRWIREFFHISGLGAKDHGGFADTLDALDSGTPGANDIIPYVEIVAAVSRVVRATYSGQATNAAVVTFGAATGTVGAAASDATHIFRAANTNAQGAQFKIWLDANAVSGVTGVVDNGNGTVDITFTAGVAGNSTAYGENDANLAFSQTTAGADETRTVKKAAGDDLPPGPTGPTGPTGAAGANGATGATGAGYAATSATSLATAGSGSKAFTTQANLAYSVGARIRATSVGTSEWMEGLVTAYSGTTLTVTMDLNSGTGTHADWNINLAGQRGAVGSDADVQIQRSQGSSIQLENYVRYMMNTSAGPLVDGTLTLVAINIPAPMIVTSFLWYQGTAGNYTADNYNGIGLYSFNGTSITLVASTANDATPFKGSSYRTASLSAPYAAVAGTYFVGFLYNTSAEVTAPALGGILPTIANSFRCPTALSNSLTHTLASQAALPAGPTFIVSLSFGTYYFWVGVV